MIALNEQFTIRFITGLMFIISFEYCVRNCNRESNFRQVSARKNTRTELEFVFPLLRLQLVIEYGQ